MPRPSAKLVVAEESEVPLERRLERRLADEVQLSSASQKAGRRRTARGRNRLKTVGELFAELGNYSAGARLLRAGVGADSRVINSSVQLAVQLPGHARICKLLSKRLSCRLLKPDR